MNFVPHREDNPSDSCTSEPLEPLSPASVTKNLARTAALALLLAPLALPTQATAATASAPVVGRAATVLTLVDAVRELPIADESREGYTRDKFKHRNAGRDPADGCTTRDEVLLSEAVESSDVAAGCKLSGGEWISYYDGQDAPHQSGRRDHPHQPVQGRPGPVDLDAAPAGRALPVHRGVDRDEAALGPDRGPGRGRRAGRVRRGVREHRCALHAHPVRKFDNAGAGLLVSCS